MKSDVLVLSICIKAPWTTAFASVFCIIFICITSRAGTFGTSKRPCDEQNTAFHGFVICIHGFHFLLSVGGHHELIGFNWKSTYRNGLMWHPHGCHMFPFSTCFPIMPFQFQFNLALVNGLNIKVITENMVYGYIDVTWIFPMRVSWVSNGHITERALNNSKHLFRKIKGAILISSSH